MSGQRVTVWRLELLRGSETFIRDQTDALSRWTPTLLGSVRVASPLSRGTDTVVFGRGIADRIRLALADLTGRSPRLAAALDRTRPDLVHAHFGKDAWMVLRAVWRARVPLVVTVHGYDVTALPAAGGLRGHRARRRLRQVLRRADAVVAVSEFIRDRVLAHGADPARTVVLPIGIRLQRTAARPRPAPSYDVVFVGRFVAKKGVVDAVAAIAAVPAALTPRCVFIGDGPLRAAAEADAAARGLDITFTGALPPDSVRHHLDRAKVFIGPSRTAPDGDAEGFGLVFLEAAAAGLPVVAYRHGGVVEAVVDGVTGLLVDEGDQRGLAAALVRLLADPTLAARLGTAGQARVCEQYDIRRRTAALEDLYDRVAAASGPGRR
ncbi:glycosyltransferase [Micromonospora sp. NBC_01813]|uniref:glycosyltransferase n=1 Tax=Micromonospora sp. NBC_01813 TaxID=2975988 RepID=UPI002DDC452F|nr:glycosyltransferase [Micromonospora sp. NBC_01813]WSA10812.1 glycosyltransferase [Micromonospora sp. NBC_01813]